MEEAAAFKGEFQFVTFADSSRGGPRVTFRLSDRDELQAFVGCEGKRYACVLVEIGDDELPVEGNAPKEQLGPLCKWAVMRDDDPAFSAWVTPKTPKAYILEVCGIKSRRELDTNPEAAAEFHKSVRKPYEAWQRRQAWLAGTKAAA